MFVITQMHSCICDLFHCLIPVFFKPLSNFRQTPRGVPVLSNADRLTSQVARPKDVIFLVQEQPLLLRPDSTGDNYECLIHREVSDNFCILLVTKKPRQKRH